MGITRRMAGMAPEERRQYMRALRSKQTRPVGFAGSSEAARQAQMKSVATRKARQASAGNGITELDGAQEKR